MDIRKVTISKILKDYFSVNTDFTDEESMQTDLLPDLMLEVEAKNAAVSSAAVQRGAAGDGVGKPGDALQALGTQCSPAC